MLEHSVALNLSFTNDVDASKAVMEYMLAYLTDESNTMLKHS